MGIDITIYLGPYAECKINARVDDGIVREQVKERLTLPMGDIWRKIMNNKEVHIWLSNITAFPGCFSCDPRTMSVSDILQLLEGRDKYKDIFAFEEFYKKEIEILDKVYGDGKVEIKYGYIHQVH